EALEDLRLDAGVERRARDDRLEELRRNAAGAGERGEKPTGREQLEREQVDVLVRPGGVARLRGRRRELRRVEDDEIVARTLVAQPPQVSEHVGPDELEARGLQGVGRKVLA